MNIGTIIKNRRLELDLTLEEVGKAVGVGKSTVQKWENGFISNMGRDKIAGLATVLQINPVTLITGEQNISPQYDNIFPIKTHKIPLLGEIACGEPIFASEDKESYVEVGTEIRADFCLKAKGDSMINARIMDGDVVFIREQPMVENGEIAAVIIDDEATLKRVYYDRNDNKLVLSPENPKYSPFVYVGEELNAIRILGKAIAFQSDVI
ncbi:MAG: helix-turn-helix domain-containing protein [Oscillospiraceae bacterium]|nr:helix-turn-helix domain-containing protein [Oscillospiraceae bacterium]